MKRVLGVALGLLLWPVAARMARLVESALATPIGTWIAEEVDE